MTKEDKLIDEIINDHWIDHTDLLSEVPHMMKEYARQKSIAFAEWICKSYEYDERFENWIRLINGEYKSFETSYLFTLYLDSLLNNK